MAHGDPQRDSSAQTPLVGPPDSSNATLASSNPAPMPSVSSAAVPMSGAPNAPLPNSTLQPSLPAVNANPAATGAPRTSGVYSTVTVTLSEHAQELAAADPRLSADAVVTAVEHELQTYRLLAPGSAAPTLAITVENFTNTLASNAMVLGFTFRNAMLTADIQVQGGSPAAALPPFDVHARTRLTSRDEGTNTGSLSGLYQRFAQILVADLRGVEPPEEPIPR